MPVFAHLEGIVHIYVDRAADLEKAKKIVLNAKLRRTGICGAAETLLVDRAARRPISRRSSTMLLDAGCEVRGDAAAQRVDRAGEAGDARTTGAPNISTRSSPCAWSMDVDGAIDHIETYGSHHTDCIVTEDAAAASASWTRSIRRSCCTTPRRNSPTAASSASAPRSASRPAACMRAARSASSS